MDIRRKFRSQTSANMGRWKSRGGKSQRRERKKKEDQRRERVRRKKIQAHEKAEKSRNTVFFKCFGAPEGRKVGSLKRRARLHAAVVRSRLWREADCGGKHIRKSKVLKTNGCRKSVHRCGAKHLRKSVLKN